jgi:shikimate kinase
MKTLFILMGLKGSGKTFIGKLIENKFNIAFLRVENIFKNIKTDRHFSDENYIKEGFTLLEKEIRTRFEKADALIMESTGLTDEFRHRRKNYGKIKTNIHRMTGNLNKQIGNLRHNFSKSQVIR